MKRITLCGLGARFTHTNLAIRCLQHAAKHSDIRLVEASINDRVPAVVRRIVQTAPDAACFSCYIWNIDLVLQIASDVKTVLPNCLVMLGGPEVSFDSVALMQQHSFIDMIVRGCGEIPFAHFVQRFSTGQSVADTPSAVIRQGCDLITTDDAPSFDMNHLPFVYDDLGAYPNQILYYETSRGCPYRCAYCMSANESLTLLPVQRVKHEFERFLQANVRQVKLVDRTFNVPAGRAYELFEALIALSKEYPDARTNFHFEISAFLLDDNMIDLLATAPKGLIQLEIGIQSTNDETLRAVNRSHDTKKLLENTRKLCSLGNIHTHTDLIAGLPHEDYQTFGKSFNNAYALGADHLQLGFLKVLKGSPMQSMAEEYGIKYSSYAPYEVLSTHVLSYDELSRLHHIEHVLEAVYNSGHFKKTLAYLVPQFDSAFVCYEQLAGFLTQHGFFDCQQSKKTLFELICTFAQTTGNADVITEALMFDWLCIEKPRRWPEGLQPICSNDTSAAIRDFYKDKDKIEACLPHYLHLTSGEIARRCHIAEFKCLFNQPSAVLFDYGKKRDDKDFVQKVPI